MRVGNKSVRKVVLHVGRGPEPMRAILSSRRSPRLAPSLERVRLTLADATVTTLWVARFERARFAVRVVALRPRATLADWCAENGAEHALIGGFYTRPSGLPL